MTLDAAELRDLTGRLLNAWDAEGHPTQISQPRARSGKKITTTDVARMECVIGLTRHVHETARAIDVLLSSGHSNPAVPLVRLVYECALTATWLVQSENDDGVKAFMHEYTRQQKSLQSTLEREMTGTFRDRSVDVADTDMSAYLGSADNVRRFDLICEDLAPGGSDAYVYYRVLSSLSHAGVPVVDLYFSPPQAGEVMPPPRQQPDTALDSAFLQFLTNAAMVWSGRAVSYLSKNLSYRRTLRNAATQLEITSEIALSDVYRKRHAATRRKKREAASR
ncbi:DUF6988 family protein [Microbacterium sp. A1-JK]|uniref:DUF6988 family protein n=1 Tax=Microbacterium sp. A1-JK TaxID=3177516 RepID=UPI00388A8D02